MAQPTLANSEGLDISQRYDDVYTDYVPNEICSAERDEHSFLFETQSGVHLQVQILSERIFRFRYAPKGRFQKDFSYAINPTFQKEIVAINFEETDTHFLLRTPKLLCQIAKSNAAVSIFDTKGNLLNADAAGYSTRSTIHKGICRTAIQKKSPKTEQFFGLGDKTCSLDLRHQNCDNYNTDVFAYGKGAYTFYRSIPFYYALNQGLAYGVFMDNTYRSHFEFDTEKEEMMTFWAEGGEMNYYFIFGPELMDVAQQYHYLTGTTALPAMWTLGFHQCRWSYYPDARVRELVATFRKEKIPCDAIYLDIDYMDEYRCFTVNKKLFPDLKGLVADLKKDGMSTIVMIDPGIKEDPNYWVYQDGLSKDVFCRRTDGDIMVGPVWPDACVFPDFTHPDARAWWQGLYRELYGDDDIDGFWNDMNEPAIFKVNNKTFPDEVLHHYDGQHGNHRKAHNIYGMQMSRATKDGLLDIKPQERPFVLTRATFSGGQRYAAVWTGDNVATWQHLQLANIQCQRMSISGFSLVGSDIGGFVDQPTGELMVRWIQMGIFHPLMRIHSMGNNADGSGAVHDNIMELDAFDRKDQEPWSYGQPYTDINRQSIELRYRLLAYLYTAFYQQEQAGTPVLSSMSFYDQRDAKLCKEERDFMFGDSILVSPVIRKNAKTQGVYLPSGQWFNYWTGKLYDGQKTVRVKTPLEQIPMFVKAGTVLQMYPVRQHTKEKIEYLEAHFYVGNGTSFLYEDAGNGFAYQAGAYRKTYFECTSEKDTFSVKICTEGAFEVDYTKVKLYFHAGHRRFSKLFIDDKQSSLTVSENGVLVAEMDLMLGGAMCDLMLC